MAQKCVVQVIDDLDGTELDRDDGEEAHFGIEGRSYVMNLSKANAAKLRGTLPLHADAARLYADAARRDQVAGRITTSSRTTSGRNDLEQVREWANANGYSVSSRGRIPRTVLDAYDVSH